MSGDKNLSQLSVLSSHSIELKEKHASKAKVFFPNLDALRFFSFLIVFFAHSFATDNAAIAKEGWYKIVKGRMFYDGDLGVSFFFVLSGFLITYLLVKEQEKTGRIHIRSFYVRRALRIWPLYYFCVLFGFIAFPFLKRMFGQVPAETANPVLCSLFLNNFNAIMNGPPDSSILSVLWSVAIEEQFYLIWPWLFFLVPPKQYLYVFILVISSSMIFRVLNTDKNLELHTLGVISDMAMGGLAAYFCLSNKSFLKFIEQGSGYINLIPYLAVLIFLLFRKELFQGSSMYIIHRFITAFFFAWIILEQNFCKNSLFKLGRLKLISNLGKYTYGLYCLHTIALLIVGVGLAKFELNQHSWQLWLLEFPLSMALSIFFCYISYHYFEKRFLNLKNRFAYIVKG